GRRRRRPRKGTSPLPRTAAAAPPSPEMPVALLTWPFSPRDPELLDGKLLAQLRDPTHEALHPLSLDCAPPDATGLQGATDDDALGVLQHGGDILRRDAAADQDRQPGRRGDLLELRGVRRVTGALSCGDDRIGVEEFEVASQLGHRAVGDDGMRAV